MSNAVVQVDSGPDDLVVVFAVRGKCRVRQGQAIAFIRKFCTTYRGQGDDSQRKTEKRMHQDSVVGSERICLAGVLYIP